MRWRSRRQPAGKRRVAVNVELEEMEEGIGHEGDRAVDLTLSAVVELERLVGFVADGERDPLDLVLFVFDMLASCSDTEEGTQVVSPRNVTTRTRNGSDSRAAIHAFDVDGSAIVIAG